MQRTTIKLVNPVGQRAAAAIALAPRLTSLTGKSIGLIDNIKPNANLFIQYIEEIQHRWNNILQRRIERQNPACHFLADQSCAVLDIDLEIIPEQFDNRQIGRCAAVGN